MRDASAEPWIRIAAAHEGSTAGAWKRALLDAGITATVEIEDARRVTPGNTPWGARGPSLFLYGVFVHEDERDRARAIVAGLPLSHRGLKIFQLHPQPIARGAFVVLLGVALLLTARSGWW